MKTYKVEEKNNPYRRRYILVDNGKIVYPQEEDLEGLDLLTWVKKNPTKLKTREGKNGIEIVDYLTQSDEIVLLDRNPNEYYPRVWEFGDITNRVIDKDDLGYFINSIEQFITINDATLDLFKYIHPSPENYNCYGNQCRNIILLICTEIEAQFIQILESNGYQKSTYRSRDFVKLKELMMLESFSLELKYYPNYPLITPFLGWDSEKPTQTLRWYDAYNKVKHDREKNFSELTISNLVDSLGALYILLVAQYGLKNVDREIPSRKIFNLKNNPLSFRAKESVQQDLLRFFENTKMQKYFEIK